MFIICIEWSQAWASGTFRVKYEIVVCMRRSAPVVGLSGWPKGAADWEPHHEVADQRGRDAHGARSEL